MKDKQLFEKLMLAESEDAVAAILDNAGLGEDDESVWLPFGGMENNFAAIGNQQSDPTGAFLEKPINGIDAVLMAACYKAGIDPRGPNAPASMAEAVERFFGVPDGRISNLPSSKQRELADLVQIVAVGGKRAPNYLIIDRGEGQTPNSFPDTFLSLLRSNKLSIPFVQGKFNSGGTGVLPFCGDHNYQLIVSRRQPDCPVHEDDDSAGLWGFTLVRRMLPSAGRRSSMYVYLAPGGRTPRFDADGVAVLPGKSSVNRPAAAYAHDLPYGTCVKLYDYRWKARSMFTTDGRFALERLLHSAALPLRLSETRDFRANYYSTTVTGGWTSATTVDEEGEGAKLEEGFPASAELHLAGIGTLPYEIAVFKKGTDKRRVPRGVTFLLNGQVHGSLRPDFVNRKLKLDYLGDDHGPLAVSVDCGQMDPTVREDFLMASRDRVRVNETFDTIDAALTDDLRAHPGLQELNQQRRKAALEKAANEEVHREVLQDLLRADPSLSALLGIGDRLVTATGPGPRPPFQGKLFPTFFRLAKEPKNGLVKHCPLNRTARVELETDAVNDYFTRASNPGHIQIDPPTLVEHTHLWNGQFEARVRVPWDANVGDQTEFTVAVTDIERDAVGAPFKATFWVIAEKEAADTPSPGPRPAPRSPRSAGGTERVALALPNVIEVSEDQWDSLARPFTRDDAIRVLHSGEDGGYDFFINVGNPRLLTELSRAKDEERALVKYWYKYGLVVAALGMLKSEKRLAEALAAAVPGGGDVEDVEEFDELDEIRLTERACNGLAQVIVPIIRTLHAIPAA
jgi:hypothetical protein